MKQKLLVFILLFAVCSAYAQKKNLEELVPQAQQISRYTYELNGLLGSSLKRKDVDKYFSKHADTYRLLYVGTSRGYVRSIQFVNQKEQAEYKSSGLVEKAEIFKNATSLAQWISVRNQYPEFKIRGVPEIDIVRALRNEGVSIPNFWKTFSEYKDDVAFKSGVLFSATNKQNIVEYIELYGDKDGAEAYVLQQNNLVGMSIREFVEIFDDKNSIKTYVLQRNNLAGMSIREFVEFFGDKASAENWVLTNLPAGKMQDIYETLGAKATEAYFDKFDLLSENGLITYIRCTKNYKKATNMICNRLNDISQAKRDGSTLQLVLSSVVGTSDIFKYRGYMKYKDEGIKYANAIIPYLKGDASSVSRVEKAISDAYNDIAYYRKAADAISTQYRENERQYQQKMCAQCEVNFKKTSFAYNERKEYVLLPGTYIKNNPGYIVMENGDKYEFYKNTDGTWYVSTGWFSSKNIKTPEQLIVYFLAECRKIHCK